MPRGKASRRSTNASVTIALAADFTRRLTRLTRYPDGTEVYEAVPPRNARPRRARRALKVFVSHSHADVKIAAAFVALLQAALPIAREEIRCTSVSGYKLPAGANVAEQLKREVYECKAFVGLLSPTSLDSTYVLFELGARWGAANYLAPLLIRNVDPSELEAPLSALNTVDAASEPDVRQFVGELAKALGTQIMRPARYRASLEAFVRAARTV